MHIYMITDIRSSISSSPLIDLSRLTLTYSLLDQPSLSGQGRHIGVATSFLSSLHRGDKLHVAIRPSASAFHLPTDVENTPLVCIGAGSGIAPFRGFIQERAAILAAGRKDIAPALLFFGCRDPEQDDLYADQLAEWEALGAADVRRAYSRAMDRSHGCRYVQDRLYRDREDVWALWEKGAKIFVCGGREVGRVVEDVCIHMAMEASSQRGKEMNEQQAKKWFASQRNERYVTDVFD